MYLVYDIGYGLGKRFGVACKAQNVFLIIKYIKKILTNL